jgi:hypothetical protein
LTAKLDFRLEVPVDRADLCRVKPDSAEGKIESVLNVRRWCQSRLSGCADAKDAE